jgi:hypothetical protein
MCDFFNVNWEDTVTARPLTKIYISFYICYSCLIDFLLQFLLKGRGLLERQGTNKWSYTRCWNFAAITRNAVIILDFITVLSRSYVNTLTKKDSLFLEWCGSTTIWASPQLQFTIFLCHSVCSGRCRTVASVTLIVLICIMPRISVFNLQPVNHVTKTQ